MKTKIAIFLFLVTLVSVNAQEKASKFSVGLHANFFSVPLSPSNMVSSVSGVYGVYTLNNNFNLKLGFEDKMLQQTDLKQYEKTTGGMLGIGYFVYQNPTKNSAVELTLSATNSFLNFSSFNEYHTDLGARFYMFNVAYIGTGIRYSQDKTARFRTSQTDNLSWYWQIGLQFRIKK